MVRLKHMYRHFFIVYKKKEIIFSLIFALILSLPLNIGNTEFLKNITDFFQGILVIEIAYIAIFYSGTSGTEKAKKLIINSSRGFNYYHYLLIKNYFSILIKFFVLLLIYTVSVYNITDFGFSFWILNIKFYNLIQTLSICAILTTVDLILSMYFFLWGN